MSAAKDDGTTPRPAPALVRRPLPAGVAERPAESVARAGLGILKAMPGLARVVSSSAWNVLEWSVDATRVSATYVAERASAGEAPGLILQEAAADLRDYAARAFGNLNAATRPEPAPASVITPAEPGNELLRRGGELLRRSNDVHVDEAIHPAFARILTEITPDEARILRFLCLEGPQPALDIRTFRPFGIGSTLVAAGLNMIAEHAGCRYVGRIEMYLTNLSRLGLVDVSKEQVEDPQRYQVIEAQPKTADALKRAGRAPKLVQRSIRLTAFGAEFVRSSLPLDTRVVSERNRVIEYAPPPGL
jgi:hypothetical protein